MHAIRFEDGRQYSLYGNQYHLILPRQITERLESEMVEMAQGARTPQHAHRDEEQVYIVLAGEALLEVEGEVEKVSTGMIAYIPRKARHRITCTSPGGLKYIYLGCWPEGQVPPPRSEEELRQYERRLLEGDR